MMSEPVFKTQVALAKLNLNQSLKQETTHIDSKTTAEENRDGKYNADNVPGDSKNQGDTQDSITWIELTPFTNPKDAPRAPSPFPEELEKFKQRICQNQAKNLTSDLYTTGGIGVPIFLGTGLACRSGLGAYLKSCASPIDYLYYSAIN